MSKIRERYSEIRTAVDREFRRNRRLHGRKIRCGRGCVDCCHQIFSITEVEAAAISRLVKTLTPRAAENLKANARAFLPERQEILRQHGYIRAWGQLPKPETRLACPALIDDECALYSERPLVCRKFGMPLYHPEQPGRIFACELNFRPGETYHDAQLVSIQGDIARQWTELQSEFDSACGRRAPEPINVADALLGDYESHIP
jgi:Fe-S-cluster containining protein